MNFVACQLRRQCLPSRISSVLRYSSTSQRNRSVLEKIQAEKSGKVVRKLKSKGNTVAEFTDNESYEQSNKQFSAEQDFQRPSANSHANGDPYNISKYDDPKFLSIANAVYRKLQPITPNDSYVSCTTFDSKGNVVAVSRRYPKMKFLKENNLFPRDLRKIDTSSIDVVPSIMVRSPNSILINLLHIKAIVKKDRVMIFDTSTPTIAKKLGLFMYDLEMKLKTGAVNNALPYEFRALETILISVMSYLDTDLRKHLQECGSILDELEDQIDRNKLRDLLIKSKSLASFNQKALLIRDVLDELLDSDETLAAMYLSEPKQYDPTVENPSDYQELEMLLEAYYNHCDEFVQQAGSLLNDIRATEEIVNIILDANRNSLMLFELKITVYTLGFAVATLVPAFYGMNLKNYIEESELGFGAVVVFSIIQGLIVTSYMFKKLRSVQKLTMMGGASMAPMKQKKTISAFPTAHFQHSLHQQWNRHWTISNWARKKSWYHRFLYGDRNTKFDRPTSREKDVIWRMINDDKPMK
ncbi:mitochondrial inner membrane magnesium transporter Mrs2p [[Candida] railenensis]|uniref:Magnesium transporter n=1 Tax=[Candida] railenensis TaxID=45579 RepID=A0A9P0QK69_9ASCO|nr:mitochondrial inner membrane magnesium transporter Mrs2p [[Candida] railenensis]